MQAFLQKILAFFMSVLAFFGIVKTDPARVASSGKQGKHHVQGLAVDEARGCIYYSFTTALIKTDLNGKLIGSVTELVGHLGCISIDPENGTVYGSLEYKHDAIGQGILNQSGAEVTDGFYIAVFDTDKITRKNMSAEGDGVMRAAFLPDVLADYNDTGVNRAGETVPHKYGCSGIDGLCLAPTPGNPAGERFLYVAYGVYSDLTRDDNDHQVLLRYDTEAIRAAARPLSQTNMHRSSPGAPLDKYFVYTGNTDYGVQNLEYDPQTQALFMAVYKGSKPDFPNYDMFAIDMTRPAVAAALRGMNESGQALTLLGSPAPESDEIHGWYFSYGQFGIHAGKNGGFYIVEPAEIDGEQAANVYLYQFDPQTGFTKNGGKN